MWDDIGFVIAAYLFGALPHLYLLGRLRGLSPEGDLHIYLWRKGGRLLGTIGIHPAAILSTTEIPKVSVEQ